jgi:serine phosphatase RsbU (regulator of sigma subunit)
VVPVKPAVPLGYGPARYEATEVQLEEGEALLLVSDGVYEARSIDGHQFGWDRMLQVVHDRFEAGDRLPEVLRRALRDVMTFQRGEPVHEGRRNDDATMVLLRWCPASAGQPAEPRASELREAEAPTA